MVSQEMQRASAQIREQQNTLELRIAETTAELRSEAEERRKAERDLAHAQRLDALGQMTGGIAHDFNNLLAAIVGNLELLRLRVSDGKGRELVEKAVAAANRGSKLIAQLLAFSRDREVEPRPFDVNALVKNMGEQLLDRTIGGTITIAYALEREPWPAMADASQIELAVLNLAINARDAMPNGGTLLIETANVPAGDERLPRALGGDSVMIAVSDTGVGMTEEVKERAFEPFYTTKEVGKGTGLGLSMVYGVAEQAGGTAAIESTVGKGTTVAIFLPRAATAIMPPAQPAPTMTSSPTGPSRGKIMLVDDDAEVRAVALSGLSDSGFEVVDCDSGSAAVAAFAENRDVRLLVTDYAMPGMNGIELIHRVRELAPHLPVIVITGYANPAPSMVIPEDLAVLRKPFHVSDLVDCVSATLARRGNVASVERPAKPQPA